MYRFFESPEVLLELIFHKNGRKLAINLQTPLIF